MYDLSTGNYSNEDVLALLKSDRTVSYEFDLLNKDGRPLGKVTADGSIDYNASAAIQRVASLNIKERKDIDVLSEMIRPYMCLKTPAMVARFPLGVFLMASPQRQALNGALTRSVDCYDRNLILSEDKFATRYYIPRGTAYTAAVASILQSAGISDARITQSDYGLASDMEFAAGTSKLSAINRLLDAINYNHIYVSATGVFVVEPYVVPELRAVNATYATDKHSIVKDGADEQLDTFEIPNKIVRVLETADRGLLVSEAVNDDPLSKLSTVSRGRTVVDVDSVDDIASQGALDAYVQRLMAESKLYQVVRFETANMPMHENLDCLYLINKDLEISGKYIEQSWKMQLNIGGSMIHTCRKAVVA